MGSIVSLLITRILKLFLFDDVMVNESLKKKKLMREALFKAYPELEPSYKYKLQRGSIKLRTIFMLFGKCKKNKIGNITININK